MGVRSISCEAAEPFDGATLALLLSSSANCTPASTGSAAPSSGSPASAIPGADSGNTTDISATSSSNVTATTYSSSYPVPANATATSDSGSSDSVTLFALAVAAVLASVCVLAFVGAAFYFAPESAIRTASAAAAAASAAASLAAEIAASTVRHERGRGDSRSDSSPSAPLRSSRTPSSSSSASSLSSLAASSSSSSSGSPSSSSRSPGGNIGASENRGSGRRGEEGRVRGSGGSREAERGENRGEGGRERRRQGHRQGQVGRRVGSHGEVGEGGKGERRETREVVGRGGREEGRCCGCGKKERAGGRKETTGTRGADGALSDVLVPIVTQGRNGHWENEESQPEAVRAGEGEARSAAGRNVQVDFSTRSVHEAVPEARGASDNPEGATGAVWVGQIHRAGRLAAAREGGRTPNHSSLARLLPSSRYCVQNESERHLLPYDMTVPVPYGWDTYTVLAAWLLRERAKGAASPWALFLRSLPAYVPLPALFPQQLIDQFEYWPIVDQPTRLKAAYADLYGCYSSNPTAVANASSLPPFSHPNPSSRLPFETPPPQATRLKAAYADLYGRCNSNPTTIVHAYSLLFFLCSPSFPRTPPQATRLKAAYADLYDRCSSNPAAIANATRSEFYWALTIVTSRCFTFSPFLRARAGGEEQQAEGAEGAEVGGDGGADGAEVAAEAAGAAGAAGGESEEGSSGSSSNGSSGGERGEDWGPPPLHDLPGHRERRAAEHIVSRPNPLPASSSSPPLPSLLQLSGDHFVFTTYKAIEKGEPLSTRHDPSPSSPLHSSPLPCPPAVMCDMASSHIKPTIDMVAEYGFVPSYNPYDTVILFPSHSKPTIDMLAEYGFVPAYNPYGSVELFPR
ncbi:unnamed protein product [Closterium sp. Naga37s-1]|nr:unnamed protein product [Closterium sp. Naga37s-1]